MLLLVQKCRIFCAVIFYIFMNRIIAKGMNCRKVCFTGLHFQSSHNKHPSTPKCMQKFMNVGGATYPITSVLHRKKLLLMWWWAFIVWQTGTLLHVRSADLIFCTFHTTLLCLKWPQGQKSLILAFLQIIAWVSLIMLCVLLLKRVLHHIPGACSCTLYLNGGSKLDQFYGVGLHI